jgi:hypothetical protein
VGESGKGVLGLENGGRGLKCGIWAKKWLEKKLKIKQKNQLTFFRQRVISLCKSTFL